MSSVQTAFEQGRVGKNRVHFALTKSQIHQATGGSIDVNQQAIGLTSEQQSLAMKVHDYACRFPVTEEGDAQLLGFKGQTYENEMFARKSDL